MTSGESSSPTPCGPVCRRTSPRKSAATPCWTPPWATPRSIPKTWSPTTGRSSPAAGPSGPAKNTVISPLANGMSSWPISSSGKSRSASAAVTMERHVRMKTLASGARSFGLTQLRYHGWKRSTPTWATGSKRPGNRAGSARSPRSRPPWPPPRRNWRPCAASPPATPPFTLGYLTSAARPDDPVPAQADRSRPKAPPGDSVLTSVIDRGGIPA